MLKLVYVNPNTIPTPEEIPVHPESSAIILSQKTPFREEVLVGILPHFAAKTEFTGLSSYTMTARDVSHYLSCSLPPIEHKLAHFAVGAGMGGVD